MKRHIRSVPSVAEFEKLADYANLLAKFGSGAPEVAAFFRTNRHLSAFAANALDLERLQREDDGWMASGKPAG